MAKYITSIRDLVIHVLKNESQIKYKANVGDPMGCFQMGMIHLLGIDTPIDFKKASSFFGHQSLSGDQNANLLLGYIAECIGDFSSAFHYYANSENSEKDNYLDEVLKGRKLIQDYIKRLDLPLVLNKEISTILNDYSKGGTSKTGASIKMAAICKDEQTCLEAARALFDSKEYISAIQWLKKGNVPPQNSLYAEINGIFEKSTDALLLSKSFQIIDLERNSLLDIKDPTPFLNKVKKNCEEASIKTSIEWKEKNKKRIDTIISIQKEKEKKELEQMEAEEAKKERRKKLIIKHSIICVVLFIIGVAANEEGQLTSKFASGLSMIINCYLWYYLIKWIWKKIFSKK